MWWHVTASRLAESTRCISTRIAIHIRQTGSSLALWRHGVLERTLCGEMIALTDTTLDGHGLEGLLLLALFNTLLDDSTGLEAGLWAEDDVLTQRGRVRVWSCRAACFGAEFAPSSSLGGGLLLVLLDRCAFDSLCALDALAFVVQKDCYDRL